MIEHRTVETFSRVITHRVQVRHNLTGLPIPGTAATLGDAPPGWIVGLAADDLIVSAPEDSIPAPAPVQMTVTVEDPIAADYLSLPAAGVLVDLDAELIEVAIEPVPLVVEVELVDGAGAPLPGADLTIRSKSGASRTTAEADPGIYRTDPHTFTPSYARFDVVIGGEAIAEGQIDPYKSTTSIKVIDPT